MKKTANKTIIILIVGISIALAGCKSNKTASAPATPPETPRNLSASDGTFGNQVQISWSASERATEYKIFKAIDRSDGEFRQVASGITVAEWVDRTATPGRMYYYRVAAFNTGGISEMSNKDSGYAGNLAPEPPFPPSAVFATGNYLYHVYLRWDAVEGATAYHLYRSDLISGIYNRISDEDGIAAGELNGIDADGDSGTAGDIFSYDDSRIVEGKAYYYRVSAVNAEGEGMSGQPVMGWFPYNAPEDPPATVGASDGVYSNKVAITWETVPSATTYSVYRSIIAYNTNDCPVDGSYYTNIGSTSSLSFDDSTLDSVDWNSYCYAVRANNSNGSSNLSVPDKGNKSAAGGACPSAPVNLSGTVNLTDQIVVTWNRADALAVRYEVFRSASANGDYGTSPVATVADNGYTSYSFTDTTANGITVDAVYYYKVRAAGSTGNVSSLSDNTSGSALPAVPSAPVISASDGADYDSITIIWTDMERAVSYNLYRSASPDGPWDATTIIAGKLSGTSYVDTSIAFLFDTIYYYAIRGVNTGGDGEISAPDGGNVELSAPGEPAATNVALFDYDITFSWNQVEGCQGYIVYWVRSTGWWGTTPESTINQINVPGGAILSTILLDVTWPYNFRFQAAAYIADGEGNIIHIGPSSVWSGWATSD